MILDGLECSRLIGRERLLSFILETMVKKAYSQIESPPTTLARLHGNLYLIPAVFKGDRGAERVTERHT